jgi:formamidopyrimidine-DNA glycosylase
MPELPEVETIARQIRKQYLGGRLKWISAQQSIIFQNIDASRFIEALQGKRLLEVSRYGKFMYWQVDDVYPVFHLGMSGIFISQKSRSLYPEHIHISITFEDNSTLFFQDVRKFSKISLYKEPPKFPHVGIDVTTEEFTLNNFKKLLNLTNVATKSILMDQRRIAGIGNIYANEILFDAGIHPTRPAGGLSQGEIQRLYQSVHKIIQTAIERFGTSYTAYLTVEGTAGENQNFLKVYQKNGESCPLCGGTIAKIILNSRSTFFCKKCQKKRTKKRRST